MKCSNENDQPHSDMIIYFQIGSVIFFLVIAIICGAFLFVAEEDPDANLKSKIEVTTFIVIFGLILLVIPIITFVFAVRFFMGINQVITNNIDV